MRPQNYRSRMAGALALLAVMACSLFTPNPTPTLPADTPAVATRTPLTPSVDGTPAFVGMVQIQGGSCCVGGEAGKTVPVQVDLSAASPFGKVEQMKVSAGSAGCNGSVDLSAVEWQPYAETLTLPVQVAINWTGFYVHAQFKDEKENVSPVYCDEISVEGMPPIPAVDTSWFPQIQCFSEQDVRPAPGERVRGPEVTFSWPATNTLPEGVFYRVFAYNVTDIYSPQVAGGTTRETSLTSPVSPASEGELVWYVVLVDASGVLIDHNRCSSFPSSLLTVDPPEGIKGIHFQYRP